MVYPASQVLALRFRSEFLREKVKNRIALDKTFTQSQREINDYFFFFRIETKTSVLYVYIWDEHTTCIHPPATLLESDSIFAVVRGKYRLYYCYSQQLYDVNVHN